MEGESSSIKNSDYISVVVPYFLRDYHLKNCLEAVHRFANYPLEVVCHDDSASEGKSIQFKDQMSTLLLNFGLNFGLHAAANRAISAAHSKYILFLNQDMLMLRACLREIKAVLDKPYVGILSLYGEPFTPKESMEVDGVRFSLYPGIGSGCAMAFRKDFWQEVGGFEENVHSGCSDTTILYRCWKFGYFRAILVGDPTLKNVSLEENQNRDTSIGPTGTDCAYPKIFGIQNQYQQMRERMEVCQKNQDGQRHMPASISNVDYWDQYSHKILRDGLGRIDWDAGVLHGQAKWKRMIEVEQIV